MEKECMKDKYVERARMIVGLFSLLFTMIVFYVIVQYSFTGSIEETSVTKFESIFFTVFIIWFFSGIFVKVKMALRLKMSWINALNVVSLFVFWIFQTYGVLVIRTKYSSAGLPFWFDLLSFVWLIVFLVTDVFDLFYVLGYVKE